MAVLSTKKCGTKSGIKTRLEKITPAKAKEYLAKNLKNRRVRRHWVGLLVKIIQSGDWKITHQGIAFDSNGNLIDGQHRLMAILESGVTVSMYVSRNVDKASSVAIDQGPKRDVLDIMGPLQQGLSAVNKDHVSTARRMVIGPSSHTDTHATNQDMIRFIRKHMEAISFVLNEGGSLGGLANACVRAPIARAWYTADRDRLIEFMQCLNSGICRREEDNAPLLLAKTFFKNKDTYGNVKGRRSLYCKTEAALRAFLEGRPMLHIKEVGTELFPLPEEA